jgi:hypothetical protein
MKAAKTTLVCLLLAAVLTGCNGVTVQSARQTPEETVLVVSEAAAQQDWGTADLYLTERLSRALQPGTLPITWQTLGADIEIIEASIVGRTATVWVQTNPTLAQLAPQLGLNAFTLQNFLENPDPTSPDYLRVQDRLAALSFDGVELTATSRITLYQQDGDWKIEFWQIAPLPDSGAADAGAQPSLPLDGTESDLTHDETDPPSLSDPEEAPNESTAEAEPEDEIDAN